jgi:hypothetical protein
MPSNTTTPSLASTEKLDPLLTKSSPDGETRWYDCQNLALEGKAWTDTLSYYDRLPGKAHGRVPEDVWIYSRCSAGMCAYFSTDAPTVQVRWTLLNENLSMPHFPSTGFCGVDLYARAKSGPWRLVGNGRPDAPANSWHFAPPADSECLLYLPIYNGVKYAAVGIPRDRSIFTPPASALKRRKTVVFYGTSIVQGGCVSRPGMAFTSIVGRMLDVQIINLGFSGCGRMEPALAELVADLDPAVFVLDCLWNLQPEQVAVREETFVQTLRAARPATPILLVEDSNFQGISPTPKGLILREVFEKLRAAGDKNLHFLSNHNMLGDDGEATVDGCHPTDLGMSRHAPVYAKALSQLLS